MHRMYYIVKFFLYTFIIYFCIVSCSNTLNDKEVKYSELLTQILESKTKLSDLSIEQNIAILKECVELTNENLNFLDKNKNNYKKSIAVLGNTGAAKSTTINYLHGCEMEYKDNGQGENVIDVKKGKQIFAKIGHDSNSMTFLPEASISEDQILYIDCPGFFDNRVFPINLANSVTAKKNLESVKNLSLILLIDVNTLLAKRAEGLKNMMILLKDLLGSSEEIIKRKKSLLFLISKVDNNCKKFNSLEAIVDKAISSLESNGNTSIRHLQDRFFSYDPLENPIKGGLKRKELIAEIHKLEPITAHEDLFNITLSTDDKIQLINICDEILTKIKESIDLRKDPRSMYNDFVITTCSMPFIFDLPAYRYSVLKIGNLKNDFFIDPWSIPLIFDLPGYMYPALKIENLRKASLYINLLKEFQFLKHKDIDNHIEKSIFLVQSILKKIISKFCDIHDQKDTSIIKEFLSTLNICEKEKLFTFDIHKECNTSSLKIALLDLEKKIAEDAERISRQQEVERMQRQLEKMNWRVAVIDKISTLIRSEFAHNNLKKALREALDMVIADSEYIYFYCQFTRYTGYTSSAYAIAIRREGNGGYSFWNNGNAGDSWKNNACEWKIGNSLSSSDNWYYVAGKGC